MRVPRPRVSPQRERILKVAAKLFSKNGFAATSMRDLAKATGLKTASLYAHLDSKEELLLEMLDEMADQFLAGAQAILAAPVGPEEKLRRFFRFHFNVVADNLSAATVHFHEFRHLSAESLRRIVRKRDAYSEAVATILQEGIADGSFRDVDLSLTSIQILSVLNYVYQWYSPRGPRSPDELSDVFADTFLRGLRRPPAADTSSPERK